MRSTIRNIGNSKGIILPQNFLKQCFIDTEVNIEIANNTIIISPVEDQKRKGWAEAFKQMAQNNDDQPVIPDVFDDEDNQEWTWK